MNTTQKQHDRCALSEGAGRGEREAGGAGITLGLLTLACAVMPAFLVGCPGKAMPSRKLPRAQIDRSVGFSEGLGRIIVGGKRGFIDTTGQVVIEPQFELAWDFSEGRAMIGSGGKRGYINSKGEVVIPVVYDGGLSFREGLAAVKANGKWGFIDRAGKFRITPRFERADDYFSEGLAPVKLNGKYGYIDTNGTFVVKPTYDCAVSFSAGLGGVRDGPYWGYVDRTGQVKLPIEYGSISRFPKDGGNAWVCLDGKTVDVPGTDCGIRGPGGKERFIDKQGKIAFLPPTRVSSLHFSEGLASTESLDTSKSGYLDATGKWIIPPKFTWAHSFSEGLAAVKLRGRFGYIDKGGRFVIQPAFDLAGRFLQGRARVVADGKAGYIDRSGSYVWRSSEALPYRRFMFAEPTDR